MDNKDENKKYGQRHKQKNDDKANKRRRGHQIYFSPDEWQRVVAKADWVKRAPAVYVREVSLGYKPAIPDPEFRHELMRCRDDIKKLFSFLKRKELAQEERLNFISQLPFLRRWITAVEKILDFLDMWMKRV